MRASKTSKTALLLVALFCLVTPAPAQAWFGWLDDLSGPGKFRGWEFDFRVACFGGPANVQELATHLNEAMALTRRAVEIDKTAARDQPGDTQRRESVVAAQRAWEIVRADVASQSMRSPVLHLPEKLERQKISLDQYLTTTTRETLGSVTIDDLKALVEPEQKATPKGVAPAAAAAKASVVEALQNLVTWANQLYAANISIGSTAVAWSACSNEKERRSSIEIGANFWHADPNPAFANNKEIKLNTLMPFFSFRVFQDPRFDVLDAGFGAGVYWFSSEAFESFSGIIVQPGRFDFHAPTAWTAYPLSSPRRWAALPTFRVGVMMFPAGFDADAFAGTGQHTARIQAELVPTWTIFVNLEPFVRKAMK